MAAPGAEPEHREFLGEAGSDPRPALIEQLVNDAGTSGSIVVHSASFERSRLIDLAGLSSEHSDGLIAMVDRLVDTEAPFKKNWYLHPGLKGRSSIKVVLPTLVPEMSYEGMVVADGMAAAITFEEMVEGRVVGEAAIQARANLLEYCKLDTLAMVKIVERLQELLVAG